MAPSTAGAARRGRVEVRGRLVFVRLHAAMLSRNRVALEDGFDEPLLQVGHRLRGVSLDERVFVNVVTHDFLSEKKRSEKAVYLFVPLLFGPLGFQNLCVLQKMWDRKMTAMDERMLRD